jgi:hypothetical protein
VALCQSICPDEVFTIATLAGTAVGHRIANDAERDLLTLRARSWSRYGFSIFNELSAHVDVALHLDGVSSLHDTWWPLAHVARTRTRRRGRTGPIVP